MELEVTNNIEMFEMFGDIRVGCATERSPVRPQVASQHITPVRSSVASQQDTSADNELGFLSVPPPPLLLHFLHSSGRFSLTESSWSLSLVG